jgi:hypothetical protein
MVKTSFSAEAFTVSYVANLHVANAQPHYGLPVAWSLSHKLPRSHAGILDILFPRHRLGRLSAAATSRAFVRFAVPALVMVTVHSSTVDLLVQHEED